MSKLIYKNIPKCRICAESDPPITRDHIAFGLCGKHYRRFKRGQTITDKQKAITKPCKYCGNERYKYKNGFSNMCKKHISTYRKEWLKKQKGNTIMLPLSADVIVANVDMP